MKYWGVRTACDSTMPIPTARMTILVPTLPLDEFCFVHTVSLPLDEFLTARHASAFIAAKFDLVVRI